MTYLAAVFVFIFGSVIGSFLNVLIWRLPRGESIIFPGSHCPKCNHPIAFYDNIPIVSYIILGGRCRHCGERISLRYPLVEGLCALGFLFAFWYSGFSFSLGFFKSIYLFSSLVAISFIDIDKRIIPEALTLPGIAVGLLFSLFEHDILNSLIGIFVGGGILLCFGFIGGVMFKKESMGFGDVELMAFIGAFLGWQKSILVVILAAFFAVLLGGGLLLLKSRKRKVDDHYIPFGPYISLAAVIACFYGQVMVDFYINSFFPA